MGILAYSAVGSNKRLLTHNTLRGREFEKINRNIRNKEPVSIP